MTNAVQVSSQTSGLAAIESKLALWLDASNINGLRNAGIANGASISNWKDLSANGQGFNDIAGRNKPCLSPAIRQRWI